MSGVFGIQLDEMWTLVQNKKNKQWLWLALNLATKQVIAFHVGGRSGKDAQLFYKRIPEVIKQHAAFFLNYWPAYDMEAGKNEQHFGVGKDS